MGRSQASSAAEALAEAEIRISLISRSRRSCSVISRLYPSSAVRIVCSDELCFSGFRGSAEARRSEFERAIMLLQISWTFSVSSSSFSTLAITESFSIVSGTEYPISH